METKRDCCFKVEIPQPDPYATQIQQFVIKEFTNSIITNKDNILDLVTDAIVATNLIRYGPIPSPESLVAIREVISYWITQSRPIPFLAPWGSEKPNGTGVDIAELCALKTISSLQERVKSFYPPGIQVNIRIEDASAPTSIL